MFNFLKTLLSSFFLKNKEPKINTIKPFFDKLTRTEYEAHPNFNYTLEEIFKYNKSDCEDRTLALAKHMHDNGFKNIRILHLSWEQEKPGHTAILYQNKVFDATATNKEDKYVYFNYDYDLYILEFKFKIIINSHYREGDLIVW
jgi:hypothetical protein